MPLVAALRTALPANWMTVLLRRLSLSRRLVVLLLSMYRFQTWNIQSVDSEAGQPLMGDSAVPLTAGNGQSMHSSTTGELAVGALEGMPSKDVAEGNGTGAAAASQAGLMRRMQFWKRGG